MALHLATRGGQRAEAVPRLQDLCQQLWGGFTCFGCYLTHSIAQQAQTPYSTSSLRWREVPQSHNPAAQASDFPPTLQMGKLRHTNITPAVGCQPSNYFKSLPKCLGVSASGSCTKAVAKHMSTRTSYCLFITDSMTPALISPAFPTSSSSPLLFPSKEKSLQPPINPPHPPSPMSPWPGDPRCPTNQPTHSPRSLRLSQPISICCLQ